ncbi:FAD-dependent thymidylate synthase [Sphingobium phage Lacusarx]|uniref:FAD-dependent thymidylate synthase n=1 Tax=Sphingobium phage Lacusarx TaxID=1980139 RepID=A0A1W6DWZ9_9CAUD|nr:FAD-dependent thymidylate synthase [Sphingobium phage Lacusarx]ARK07443.1 FAD-dependent thymidylate synthase [Sphingobium phage Lacusarx]
MFTANILTDSIGVDAPRLTSMELVYPFFIHGEFMTHRVFSRNASSSRAIPVQRMIAAIRANPAMPAEWRMNEAGMQGWTKATAEVEAELVGIWLEAMEDAIRHAERMDRLKAHKQHINRVVEPFKHMRVVVTGTDWDNFYGLRDHPDADPSMQALAKAIIAAREASTPTLLGLGDWHLPYILPEDEDRIAHYLRTASMDELRSLGLITNAGAPVIEVKKKVSAARCARTSYRTHSGEATDIVKDIMLYNKLVGAAPIHASPVEHQATPDSYLTKGKRWMNPQLHGNLRGWNQNRKFLPGENLQRFDDLPLAA